MTEAEFERQIWGRSTPSVRLSIQSQKDNRYREFDLIKAPLDNLRNHTFSFTLRKEMHNVGYVRFPSFYYANPGSGDRSSGQDLATILLGFNTQQVNELVVDLRNNGGGSMQEAIDLAGFFVDYGPLFMTSSREYPDGRLEKDTKKGRLFRGKVIWLVNNRTASAAELVAATLKHYPNQLVVGSDTFGKATGQLIYPLSYSSMGKPFGMVKVTMIKIFDIDGSSYQRNGVKPDIMVADNDPFNFTGEDTYSNYLKNGSLNKSFAPKKRRQLDVEVLKAKLKHLSPFKESTVGYEFNDGFHVPLEIKGFQQFIKDAAEKERTMCSIEIIDQELDEVFKPTSSRIKASLASDHLISAAFDIFDQWNLIEP